MYKFPSHPSHETFPLVHHLFHVDILSWDRYIFQWITQVKTFHLKLVALFVVGSKSNCRKRVLVHSTTVGICLWVVQLPAGECSSRSFVEHGQISWINSQTTVLGNQRFHGFITNHQPIYKKQKTEHSTKFITKNYAPLPQKITDMKHNDQKTTQIYLILW